jgi:hypothetical protein
MSDAKQSEVPGTCAEAVCDSRETRKRLLAARRLYTRLGRTKRAPDRHALESASGWLFSLLVEISPEFIRDKLMDEPGECGKIINSAAKLTDSLARLDNRILEGMTDRAASAQTGADDHGQGNFFDQLFPE